LSAFGELDHYGVVQRGGLFDHVPFVPAGKLEEEKERALLFRTFCRPPFARLRYVLSRIDFFWNGQGRATEIELYDN
jgi:hypothetical protein